jgi:hypothetical protein
MSGLPQEGAENIIFLDSSLYINAFEAALRRAVHHASGMFVVAAAAAAAADNGARIHCDADRNIR